mmetsp:Transcript_15451/g.35379  ORF Transcript_15451/g.35379 Transcript_15451/m.35379 type:complete len:256 (-) Transcript_15451:2562-3329(-)
MSFDLVLTELFLQALHLFLLRFELERQLLDLALLTAHVLQHDGRELLVQRVWRPIRCLLERLADRTLRDPAQVARAVLEKRPGNSVGPDPSQDPAVDNVRRPLSLPSLHFLRLLQQPDHLILLGHQPLLQLLVLRRNLLELRRRLHQLLVQAAKARSYAPNSLQHQLLYALQHLARIFAIAVCEVVAGLTLLVETREAALKVVAQLRLLLPAHFVSSPLHDRTAHGLQHSLQRPLVEDGDRNMRLDALELACGVL